MNDLIENKNTSQTQWMRHWQLFLSIVLITLLAVTTRLMAAPFTAPANLNPTCAPGSGADCTVVISITGVSGGQSVVGGSASGDDLTLSSTSDAVKGNIIFGTSVYDETNNVLGIGTSAPVPYSQLQVASDQVNTIMTLTSYSDDLDTAPYLMGRKAGGTAAAPTALVSGQQILGIGGQGYYSGAPSAFPVVSTSRPNPSMLFMAGGSWTDTSQPSNIDFYVTNTGSVAPARALTVVKNATVGVINNLGINVSNFNSITQRLEVVENSTSAIKYIGNFQNTGDSANSKGLFVQSGLNDPSTVADSSLVNFADGDGDADAVGSISFHDSLTYYNTSSDRKLKENIVDTSLSLSDLMSIKIRDYNWKNDKNKKLAHGVVAQELAEVYPNAVSIPDPSNPDGIWQVDYSKLTPLIIKSIQDQQLQILDLQLRSGYAFDSSTASASIASTFMNFLATETDKVIGGIVTMSEVIMDKLTAKEIKTDKICMGDTCITEEQFRQVFNNQNIVVPVIEISPDVVVPEEVVPTVSPEPISEPIVEPAL